MINSTLFTQNFPIITKEQFIAFQDELGDLMHYDEFIGVRGLQRTNQGEGLNIVCAKTIQIEVLGKLNDLATKHKLTKKLIFITLES